MPHHKSPSRAAALQYRSGKDRAPRVVAKGDFLIAEQIIELAKAHDIPINESPELVKLLSQVKLDDEIPETLYQVVAELLAFIHQLQPNLDQQSND